MDKLEELYNYAFKKDIQIYNLSFDDCISMSLPSDDIAIDKHKLHSSKEEFVCLAHEIGHCQTGSFYNIHSPFDIRQKHENHADRWAIKKIIPKDDLDKAVKKGITALWELAEYFNVTEIFVKKAIEYYSIAG